MLDRLRRSLGGLRDRWPLAWRSSADATFQIALNSARGERDEAIAELARVKADNDFLRDEYSGIAAECRGMGERCDLMAGIVASLAARNPAPPADVADAPPTATMIVDPERFGSASARIAR